MVFVLIYQLDYPAVPGTSEPKLAMPSHPKFDHSLWYWSPIAGPIYKFVYEMVPDVSYETSDA